MGKVCGVWRGRQREGWASGNRHPFFQFFKPVRTFRRLMQYLQVERDCVTNVRAGIGV